MHLIISIGLFLLLVVSVYQDFRFSAISWIVFPLLSCISLMSSWLDLGLKQTLVNTICNSSFILLQFSLITAYFSLRRARFIFIVNKYIGIGDILFLFSITPLFSLDQFILYLVFSLILALLIFGIIALYRRDKKSILPMAGLLSLTLITIFLTNWTLPDFSSKILKSIVHSIGAIGVLFDFNPLLII